VPPSPPHTGPDEARSADEIVVATFNVRNGLALDGRNSWWLRRRTTAAAINSLDADLIGLQEVYAFQRRYLLGKLPDHEAIGRGRARRDAGEQCPILVRRPVQITSHVTRWFGDHPDQPGTRLANASFPRLATIARCRHTLSGRAFEVANVHLDEHVSENRALSTQLLAGWLDDRLPSLVMGDFNTVEEDTVVFAPLIDAGFGFVPFDRGTSHQFCGGTDGRRLDHMLLRATAATRWGVVSSGVWAERTGRRLPSDHWPAVARVRLTDA
jgi:endonuclease/exonuclease/phosphatase family metal-dependent hydrolase